MKRGLVFLTVALVVLLALALNIFGYAKSINSSVIFDVSWPKQNCQYKLTSQYAIGIVGVNGGLDFRSNSCLSSELNWFNHYALYMNTGYPGESYGQKYAAWPKHCQDTDNSCLAYNYGYNAAIYTIKYADQNNAHTASWWLDVETDNSWTSSYNVNRQMILGARAALNKNSVLPTIVGIYSTTMQWHEVVGNWKITAPDWLATGGTEQSDGVVACRQKPFTSGSIWLTQYTRVLDENYPCNNQFDAQIYGVNNVF